jgi:hypothetical protein
MTIVNKPFEEYQIVDVKCYKCDTVFKVHPLNNMYSPFVTDCDKHKKEIKND